MQAALEAAASVAAWTQALLRLQAWPRAPPQRAARGMMPLRPWAPAPAPASARVGALLAATPAMNAQAQRRRRKIQIRPEQAKDSDRLSGWKPRPLLLSNDATMLLWNDAHESWLEAHP